MASRLDRFFGGQPGAADKVLKQMQQTYGSKQGKTVFDATVTKRRRKETKGGRSR